MMQRISIQTFRILSVIAGAFAIAGCGNQGHVDLANVTGTVLQKDQPFSNAWVEFFPEFDARPAVGRTDEQGKFILNYVGDQKGARAGKYTVKIGTGGILDPKDPSGRTNIPKVQVFEKSGVQVEPKENEMKFEISKPG